MSADQKPNGAHIFRKQNGICSSHLAATKNRLVVTIIEEISLGKITSLGNTYLPGQKPKEAALLIFLSVTVGRI